jgi:hypothetical protein
LPNVPQDLAHAMDRAFARCLCEHWTPEDSDA